MHIDFVGKILIWKKNASIFKKETLFFQTTLRKDLVYDIYLGMDIFLSGIYICPGTGWGGGVVTPWWGTKDNPSTWGFLIGIGFI